MPNINKILLTYMENIKDSKVEDFELELLKQKSKSQFLKVYVWEEKSNNIPDDEYLKLVILKNDNKSLIREIIRKKGNTPRIKSNTVFVLYPSDIDKGNFTYQIKRKIAYESILAAPNLNLSNDQKKEIKKELEKLDSNIFESLRKYYRLVAMPSKDDYKVIDLGVPTYGDNKTLSDEVYEKLVAEKEILERLSPNVIKVQFLKNNDYISTESIYTSSLTVPGFFRISSRRVLEYAIEQGVREGLFGIGVLEGNSPICKHYKNSITVYFDPNEIIIKDSICITQMKKENEVDNLKPSINTHGSGVNPPQTDAGTGVTDQQSNLYEQLSLNFEIPKGKVSSLMGLLNFLQSKYEHLKIDIKASDGKITNEEYEEKIKEALKQAGIEIFNG